MELVLRIVTRRIAVVFLLVAERCEDLSGM